MSVINPLDTWNAETYVQALSEAMKIAQANNIEQITPGSPLASGVTNFALLLSDAATVGLTTAGGQTITIGLPAGYQPIRVSAVASVSTGTAYALW